MNVQTWGSMCMCWAAARLLARRRGDARPTGQQQTAALCQSLIQRPLHILKLTRVMKVKVQGCYRDHPTMQLHPSVVNGKILSEPPGLRVLQRHMLTI